MQQRPEPELDVSDSSFSRILPEDPEGVRLSRLQSTLLAASQVLIALYSLGPAPWVALAAACFACGGLQVGPSLAARSPATAAHEGEAASGEDEDQWTVYTDAGAIGSIDTGDRRHGGVVDRRRHGVQ